MFYGPNIHSPLNLGVCDEGFSSCKCTQGKNRTEKAIKSMAGTGKLVVAFFLLKNRFSFEVAADVAAFKVIR